MARDIAGHAAIITVVLHDCNPLSMPIKGILRSPFRCPGCGGPAGPVPAAMRESARPGTLSLDTRPIDAARGRARPCKACRARVVPFPSHAAGGAAGQIDGSGM